MIPFSMIYQGFRRYGVDMAFKFPQCFRYGNGSAAGILINEISKTKVMADKAFHVLHKGFGILVDEHGFQFKCTVGILNIGRLYNRWQTL